MRIGLVKGRRWQWVPNCPISRIVAFVEKVSNLGPNRGDCETAGGTSTRGDSCFSNRLYPPPPPPPAGGACLCRVPKHAATVEKGYLSKKSGTQPESFEPPSQIRPMKKVHWKDERRKGGKLSTSGSLGCRPGQAITIIARMPKIVKTGRNQDWFGFDYREVIFMFVFVSVFQ